MTEDGPEVINEANRRAMKKKTTTTTTKTAGRKRERERERERERNNETPMNANHVAAKYGAPRG